MAHVLTSWKEIAQYVGRGVRTVQRWERRLDFPVRRPDQRSQGMVIALPEELDAWLRSWQKQNGNQLGPEEIRLRQQVMQLQEELEMLRKQLEMYQRGIAGILNVERLAFLMQRKKQTHASVLRIKPR